MGGTASDHHDGDVNGICGLSMSKFKGASFYPPYMAYFDSVKAPRLKYSKKLSKTDYITETDSDGKVIIKGVNNYYGTVRYRN